MKSSKPAPFEVPPVGAPESSFLGSPPIEPDWGNEDTAVSRVTDTGASITEPGSDRDRATLVVLSGFNAGQVFGLEEHENVIGRGREAVVRLEEAGVSRQHARIRKLAGGDHLLEDLGSTNGTFVNGRRVQRVQLRPGDQVRVGPNLALSFSIVGVAEETLARQLYESSTRDALTQAYNRRYFMDRLVTEVAYSLRHEAVLGAILFDIDRFKALNDTHGHLIGDEVLRQLAERVTRTVRTEDVFARLGGEEFVVLVRGIDSANLVLFAERLRRSAQALQVESEGVPLSVTISLGVALLHECSGSKTAEGLLALADERLYEAKRTGRNRVVC